MSRIIRYAAVGSRKISGRDSFLMNKLGFVYTLLGRRGYSGAAPGTDTEIEFGARLAVRVMREKGIQVQKRPFIAMLPWKEFSGLADDDEFSEVVARSDAAKELARRYHANYDNLPYGGRSLMLRNGYQILQENLDTPVDQVLAWTADGCIDGRMTTPATGGTGQALRLATDYGVPILNLGYPPHKEDCLRWLLKYESRLEAWLGESVDSFLMAAIDAEAPADVAHGDIVDLVLNADTAYDTIVHGVSCQNVMGVGVAERIAKEFPEAKAVYLEGQKGDKRRLGTYSVATVTRNDREIRIINAVTQQYYSRDPDRLHCDYEAIRKVFKSIRKDFPESKILYPRVGAGLANGSWVTISRLIRANLKGLDHALVKFD